MFITEGEEFGILSAVLGEPCENQEKGEKSASITCDESL